MAVDIKRLLDKCNGFCTQALYDAAGLAVARTHYEVAAEHMLLKCLESRTGDMALLLESYRIDRAAAIQNVTRSLDAFRAGNSARPSFSPLLIDLLEAAWLISSVELGQGSIRSGAVLLTYAARPGRYSQSDRPLSLETLNRDEAQRNFATLTAASVESAESAEQGEAGGDRPAPEAKTGASGFVAQFCEDFTAKARAGKIDTVFGRDGEIRNILTILARRRKNNPILVGEPGVGKTAVIEGLAKRIAEGDVPDTLKDVSLLSLDMGLLEAGAGMKGEFERRLKGVIDEVKASPKPIVLFIDEAHMLVGAGGQAGGSDAANLLKPALARGELRTCAATTWNEYKKYFEKDPALARRFQLVSLEEPDARNAGLILRGLRDSYEKAHGVLIRDDAIDCAVSYSQRFISGRFLPDKAIDLMDTACAKVKMSCKVKPAALEDAQHEEEACRRELDALERDEATGESPDKTRMESLKQKMEECSRTREELQAQWERETATAEKYVAARAAWIKAQSQAKAVEGKDGAEGPPAPSVETPGTDAKEPAPAADSVTPAPTADAASPAPTDDAGASSPAPEDAPAQGDGQEPAAPKDVETLKREMEEARAAYIEAQSGGGLTTVEVTTDVVAQVVSDWTGIPVGKVAREEAALVADIETHLHQRIRGQDGALATLGKVIKASKAGLRPPHCPIGVFLLVGPSGVGKTETGLALADMLFGSEENAITLNMSEFQERHMVARLVGSPPGYVGYGEGGMLTEAVRRKPYSVILLDEAEKAHPDVMNLFYQVFDKGVLTDGEGKQVNFSETVILLTSNLGSNALIEACGQATPPDDQALEDMLRPELERHFKPALLARMTTLVYRPLGDEALAEIAQLKLEALGKRLADNDKVALHWSQAMKDTLVARCKDVETGARNIDHILAQSVLPMVAQTILARMTGEEKMPPHLSLCIDDGGNFVANFSDEAPSEDA
jgi:type VI secretion system protein VasG